tara:strand:+ start:589 stop:864 length:276 start_codon:yes stop_codon:yes gene_type:complete
MSTYPVDIKSTNITSTGAGTIFAGPCRILGLSYNGSAGAGTIVIQDGSTTICTIDSGTGTEYMQFPGTGLRCETSGKCTLTTVDKVTFFYG